MSDQTNPIPVPETITPGEDLIGRRRSGGCGCGCGKDQEGVTLQDTQRKQTAQDAEQ